MNIKHYLKHPNRIITRIKLMKSDRLSDKDFIELSYYNILGRKPNISTPVRYTEKVQWFKLHCRDLRYINYIDKYEVREIIQKKIGSNYLIPILGHWNNFDDIDFENLPNKFVLKCNHDSHSVIICKNKLLFDKENARKKITKALNTSFYTNSREWLYSKIKPCIIAEEYIEDSNHELRDYKFWCFDGKVKFVNVFTDRNKEMRIATMTRDWKVAKFINNEYPPIKEKLDKPQNYECMVELAEFLSKEFSHVRMDFYNVDGKIYFGEYTFTPASGFQKFIPDEYDYKVGTYWDLSKI